MFIKCFTITAECVLLLGLVTSINSTTVFYENSFSYSEEYFPFSQNDCQYEVIDYFAITEGYEVDGKFRKDPHLTAVTISGTEIDLYNSTYLSTDYFKKSIEDLLAKKSIEIKSVKTV